MFQVSRRTSARSAEAAVPKMRTIEVDSDVYGAIAAKTRGLHDTPNIVLRRLLLGPAVEPPPAHSVDERDEARPVACTGPELVAFLTSAPLGAADLVVDRARSAGRAVDPE